MIRGQDFGRVTHRDPAGRLTGEVSVERHCLDGRVQSLEIIFVDLAVETVAARAERINSAEAALGGLLAASPVSRRLPQGIVNLEAMEAGRAVVASRVGGVPEIVLENQVGLLVPGEDADALAQAIITLSDDAALRERLGTAGKARAQQFDWPQIARQYRDIYEKIQG